MSNFYRCHESQEDGNIIVRCDIPQVLGKDTDVDEILKNHPKRPYEWLGICETMGMELRENGIVSFFVGDKTWLRDSTPLENFESKKSSARYILAKEFEIRGLGQETSRSLAGSIGASVTNLIRSKLVETNWEISEKYGSGRDDSYSLITYFPQLKGLLSESPQLFMMALTAMRFSSAKVWDSLVTGDETIMRENLGYLGVESWEEILGMPHKQIVGYLLAMLLSFDDSHADDNVKEALVSWLKTGSPDMYSLASVYWLAKARIDRDWLKRLEIEDRVLFAEMIKVNGDLAKKYLYNIQANRRGLDEYFGSKYQALEGVEKTRREALKNLMHFALKNRERIKVTNSGIPSFFTQDLDLSKIKASDTFLEILHKSTLANPNKL